MFNIDICVTDVNVVCEPETTYVSTSLKDRWGWWRRNPKTKQLEVYVYSPPLTKIQQYGFVLHELIEMFFVEGLGANESNPWIHRFACIIELVCTLGKDWNVLFWR